MSSRSDSRFVFSSSAKRIIDRSPVTVLDKESPISERGSYSELNAIDSTINQLGQNLPVKLTH